MSRSDVEEERAPSTQPAPHAVALTDRAPRAAIVGFIVVALVAIPIYVVRGRHQWFYQDEWDFLASRDGGSLHDLLRPHNEHWSTLPIIVYRILWRTIGLRSYLVYQAMTIGLHLMTAALLRLVMRRAGVSPWIATTAACTFVLFGAGSANVVWAFQITFLGSVVLGLCHLLLSDHAGPVDRRDGLGLLCGLLALMCSGVGVTMAVIVGVAALARRGRRGWRVAALHTLPLALVYLLWWYSFARDAYAQTSGLSDAVRFAWTGIENAVSQLGQVRGMGVVLTAVLVAGLLVAAQQSPAALRRRAALPLAMAAGVVVFFLLTGFGRAEEFGLDFARRSRYAHIGVVLLLPAFAVAIDAIVRRWRSLAIPAVALLVVGIPGNIAAITTMELKDAPPKTIVALPIVPAAKAVPRSSEPFAMVRRGMKSVTIGWLLDGVASGRIPRLREVEPSRAAYATLLIALRVENIIVRGPRCRPLTTTLTRRLDEGGSIAFRGTLLVSVRTPEGVPSRVTDMTSAVPRRIVTSYGPLLVTIGRSPGQVSEICGR